MFQYNLVCGEPRATQLGMQLAFDSKRRHCWVYCIDVQGLVAEKNRMLVEVHHGHTQLSAMCLRVSDIIVCVNGKKDLDLIRAELEHNSLIHIGVLRYSNLCPDPLPFIDDQQTTEESNSAKRPMQSLPAMISSQVEEDDERTQQTLPVQDERNPQWTAQCSAEVIQDYDPSEEPDSGYLTLTCGSKVEVQEGTFQFGVTGLEGNLFESYVYAELIKDGQVSEEQEKGWVPTEILRQLGCIICEERDHQQPAAAEAEATSTGSMPQAACHQNKTSTSNTPPKPTITCPANEDLEVRTEGISVKKGPTTNSRPPNVFSSFLMFLGLLFGGFGVGFGWV